jgi:hypothetical protein
VSLLLAAASTTQQDNTVAVVAVVVSGLVGVVAPLIISVASGRRSARELAAAEARQHAALIADQERLESQLAAEGERLEVSLDDARRAARRDVREVLDAGAVLLQRYRSAFATIEVAIGAPRPVVLSVSDEWRAAGDDVVAQRARLLLWFDEGEPLVEAFDEVAKLAHYLFELRSGFEPAQREDAHLRPSLIEAAERDFEEQRLRYLRAARSLLS